MIDRNNPMNAKKLIESFIPDKDIRNVLMDFLADSIIHANELNCSNWNLNLDKTFIRFNAGQEYCIEIRKNESLFICMRKILERQLKNKELNIVFMGYNGKKIIRTGQLSEAKNCLVKVPGSVGCYIKHSNITDYLNYIEEANKNLIDYAIIKTSIKPKMMQAHSTGSIEYISNFTMKKIPNPVYLMTEEEYHQSQENLLTKARKMTDLELEKEISELIGITKKANVPTTQYLRNPLISEFVKRKAKGICQDCKQPAPFISKLTNEPYLESHHIQPLSDGGLDIVDNVIALCPNCHRKRHFGQ